MAILVSLAIHGAVAVCALGAAPVVKPRVRRLPIGIIAAPKPPPPPVAPPVAAPAPPPPKPKPKPVVHKPKPVAVAVVVDAGVESADAGVEVAATQSVADAGAAVAVVGDAGAAVAIATADAGAPQQLDPAVVDLQPYVPGGARVMLVLRGDRLRGTPWAEPLDAILAPMPDYRFLFAGTGLTVAETFETLVIASPDPRDVTATFVAARSTVDGETLRRALTKPAPGDSGARVVWSAVAGGLVGDRQDTLRRVLHDPRVLVAPAVAAGWTLLARPDDVATLTAPGAPPEWLDKLQHIEEQTGDALAVLMLADPTAKTVAIPHILDAVPAPVRLTIALNADAGGLTVTGAAVMADVEAAKAFRAGVEAARTAALGSMASRFVLHGLRLDGAVERLRFAQDREYVTFSTSLSGEEAGKAMEQAAAWTHDYFLGNAR